jgi:hypothetical protein
MAPRVRFRDRQVRGKRRISARRHVRPWVRWPGGLLRGATSDPHSRPDWAGSSVANARVDGTAEVERKQQRNCCQRDVIALEPSQRDHRFPPGCSLLT